MFDSPKDTGSLDVYKHAAADLLPATKEYFQAAEKNLPAFTEHVVSEAISSLTVGTMMGALIPKGPAGFAVAAAFTVPMVIGAVRSLKDAHDESVKPGANQDQIAHDLAARTVAGTVDFGVNMAGGYGGTEVGYRLSRTESLFGSATQAAQRGVLKAENESLVFAASPFLSRTAFSGDGEAVAVSTAQKFGMKAMVKPGVVDALSPNAVEGLVPRTLDIPARPVFSARTIEPEQMPFMSRAVATIARRVDQYNAVKASPESAAAPAPAFNTYRATFHGHTKYDDGMGTADENYAKAIEGKLDIAFLTPHNHDGARQGVGPDDPRAGAEAGVPILAQTPAEYAAIIDAATAASKPGKFYAGYGVEAGTIGPGGHSHGPSTPGGDGSAPTESITPKVELTSAATLAPPEVRPDIHGTGDHLGHDAHSTGDSHEGHDHDTDPHDGHDHPAPVGEAGKGDGAFDPLEAARQSHHGGVNHINIFGIKTSLIVADRQPHPVMKVLSRLIGRDVPIPDIKHYPDGDYKSLAAILGQTKDVTGQPPIVQFNHPRFNTNSETDYGVTSFADKQEWLDQFVRPYVKLQEVVKGEALNSSPVVETMKPGDFDPNSFSGYVDMGVHAGPTYGRDSHFGDPGGRPAGTGLLATSLDEPGVFEAMRNRRTFATTNFADLQGVLTANNDSIYMGTVLDQAAVPNLNLKLKVSGNIAPDAQYEIKLMADEQIGDGKVAVPAKTINMSGADLLKANQEVTFDPIQHKLGNTSGYYVQVSRTAAGSTSPDRMLTAPIWVEPLSGDKHGLLARTLIGNGSQYVAAPFIPKFLPQ